MKYQNQINWENTREHYFLPDGVSLGQFYQVLFYELDAIHKYKARASLESTYQPPVTFLVVHIRHHMRYARCTRSVSFVPVPPASYGHLGAFRTRFYMEPETSDSESMASGAAAGRGVEKNTMAANAAVRPLPALKEKVSRGMSVSELPEFDWEHCPMPTDSFPPFHLTDE
ncbi:hypothetical protein POM88_047552 [Heracleum sosnowskyi]|uniref:Piwi domain-containing protein n=1 Tax=Heracleum sosnowskyi TaxID=360622 RepID=A0AAD8GUK0_9APIA|nr:hypothetical protein POM88_047552 [Heracleum sosnowskyi]